jgi:hypothetical protein
MRYMLLIYQEGSLAEESPAEIEAHADAFTAYLKGLIDRGIWKASEPLQPVSTATTVRVRDGEVLVTDGPFAETKEQLASFFLIDCRDLDEAIEVAAGIPNARVGSIEVRPVWEDMVEAVKRRFAK